MRFKDYPFSVKFLVCILVPVYFILSFWMFYPYTPMIIKSPIEVCNEDKQIYPGDFLIYKLDMDKRVNVQCTVYRQLVNDFSILYSPVISNIPKGKKVIKVKLKIPRHTELGEYKLRWEVEYQVNPIRKVSVMAWSEPFYVVEK